MSLPMLFFTVYSSTDGEAFCTFSFSLLAPPRLIFYRLFQQFSLLLMYLLLFTCCTMLRDREAPQGTIVHCIFYFYPFFIFYFFKMTKHERLRGHLINVSFLSFSSSLI